MYEPKKQITFDLDTKALQEYYPTENWRNAYEVIKHFMAQNDFQWLQGSVYVSTRSMSSVNVEVIVLSLIESNPWLNLCMRDCRVTNIGRSHNMNHLFNKELVLPTREERQTKNCLTQK